MGGLVSTYYLPGRWQRANALAKEPQRITLHDLATKGPGDNPHVLVTDFTCGSEYVFEIQSRKGAPQPSPDQTGWGRAWIPLLPKSSSDRPDAAPPTSFAVLLETSPTFASGTGFHLLSRKQSMEGLAVPLSRKNMPLEVRDKLTANYPDTDFGACLFLEQYEGHHKEDASVFATALAIVASSGVLVGLPALALGIFFGRSKRKQIDSSETAGRSYRHKAAPEPDRGRSDK
jgi:hypothetical protein